MASLPDPLPNDPMPLVDRWLEEARGLTLRNPGALAIATADAAGRPSVRFVLLKHLAVGKGYLVFYTNYGSRKARELEASGRAAGAMYWESLGRQLRFEGPVVRSPADESDAYFASRPRGSQLNAWTSKQSQRLEDPGDLRRRLERLDGELAGQAAVTRPPFWGGYRLWIESVELWCEGVDRFHERARYSRELVGADDGFRGDAWRLVRLQP